MDWNKIAISSHYDVAVAVRAAMSTGDYEDAAEGLEELINALSRSDERALTSRLEVLMAHIIKWRIQPDRRSRSWTLTIREQRHAIDVLRRKNPRFTQRYIVAEFWEDGLVAANLRAQREMDIDVDDDVALDWDDVFETPYLLP